jgi:hypothetical protein
MEVDTIPSHEYNTDERAERARGAGIAFLIVAVAAVVIPVTAILIFLLAR